MQKVGRYGGGKPKGGGKHSMGNIVAYHWGGGLSAWAGGAYMQMAGTRMDMGTGDHGCKSMWNWVDL